MDGSISGTGIKLSLDAAVYSEAIVFKCFYWYSGLYEVSITRASSITWQVLLEPKSGGAWEPETLLAQIRKDLIDFKLRDIVTKETQTVRELIIAKAFAYAGLTSDPVTDVSDPVGFKPEDVASCQP